MSSNVKIAARAVRKPWIRKVSSLPTSSLVPTYIKSRPYLHKDTVLPEMRRYRRNAVYAGLSVSSEKR